MKWNWWKPESDSNQSSVESTSKEGNWLDQIPSDLWIEICKCATPLRFSHLNTYCDLRSPIRNEELMRNDAINTGRRRRRNNFALLQAGSSLSASHEIEIIQASKILSMVSRFVYQAVSHLRFTILILYDPKTFEEQFDFFQENPRFSNFVGKMMIDLDKPDSMAIENDIVKIRMCHFCTLKALELNGLYQDSQGKSSKNGLYRDTQGKSSKRGRILIPDLRGLPNLKLLVIGSLHWIQLVSEMAKISLRSDSSEDGELPRLSRLVVKSYSLLAKPLMPTENESIRNQIIQDILADLKKTKADEFLKSLLGIAAQEVSEEEELGRGRGRGSTLEDSFSRDLDFLKSNSRDTIGKLIIQQGLPTIKPLCELLKRSLIRDLDALNQFGDFVVIGEFKSWTS